jgi:glutamate synthase (NADPH/NADH) large chain
MTGGSIVVLGEVGLNLGAGMTGGFALVFDEQDQLANRYNNELVDINRINDEKTGEFRAFLKARLEKHLLHTGSARARWMLENFDDAVNRFWLVKPKALTLDSLLKD